MVTDTHSESIAEDKTRVCAVLQCPGCKKFILGIVIYKERQPGGNVNGETVTYEKHYPLGKPSDEAPKEIPKAIRNSFREAIRCRSVNAYNATAEMCGRALEASCLKEKAQGESLMERIKWLKSVGIITSSLENMAQSIWLGRNLGAHPGRELTAREADAVIAFTRQYFHHVYVMEAERVKHDFRRKKSPKISTA
jgi:hypothetical protein